MASSILKSSDENPQCYPCHKIDDVTIDAVYLCEDCNHELCEDCLKCHRKTLVTRDHQVIKLRHTHCDESEFQVSGRRFKKRAEINETKSGQRDDQRERLRDLTLSSDVSNKPGTSKAANVYKTATLKSDVNVSIDSDAGPCEVKGIVLIQDKIIICDNANSKLKVFDFSHKFLYEHVCGGKPNRIDKLDDTTVVVSIQNDTIKLLSVGGDSMTELLKIKTELPCYGVCCFDGKIYCAVRSIKTNNSELFSNIHVYTPDGKLKRRFEYLSDGKVEYDNLGYITVNPQTGTLYVTDWDKGVLALSTSGRVIAVMSTPLLKNPSGIAVDDLGQIYVCVCSSHNVIRMSADRQDAVEMLSKNRRCESSQCITVQGNKMFLARRRSDTVSVYELS